VARGYTGREVRKDSASARQTVILGPDFLAAEDASRIMGSLLRLGRLVNAMDALSCRTAAANDAD
jgi:hypothetical protein